MNAVPLLKHGLADYGSRAPPGPGPVHQTVSPSDVRRQQSGDSFLALFRLPHHFFLHFYVLSMMLSIFWAYQITVHGTVINLISINTHLGESRLGMSIEQVKLLWLLMAVQGYRRLYESIVFFKQSSSTMPLTIYLVGILYYFFLNIAIWLEGVGTLYFFPDIYQY